MKKSIYPILFIIILAGCNTDDELSGNEYILILSVDASPPEMSSFEMRFENGVIELINFPEDSDEIEGRYTLEDQALEIELARDNDEGRIVLEDLNHNEDGYTGNLGETDITIETGDNELAARLSTIDNVEEGSDIRLSYLPDE
jgi:hypothetical protein